jgi:hypothetical protein
MNRPSNTEFALGHKLGVTLTTSAAAFGSYVWATAHISWLIPAVFLVLCRTSFTARRKVVAYKAWERDWREMRGDPPTQDASKRKRRRRQWAIAACLGCWVSLTAWLTAHAGEPASADYNSAAAAWMLLSALGAGAALLQLARWMFRLARATGGARSARTHVVSVCLPVPRGLWGSPGPRQFRARLPKYARALLAQGAGAPTPSGDAPYAPSPTM